MAKSLAKLNEQIAKLQKEVDSIQSTVIARIKREIAQYGLTAEHLFSATDSTFIGNGRKAAAKTTKTSAAKKSGAAKPAKYADDQGNSWHGIGKRPQWIHAALNAGHALENFLVSQVKGAKKSNATVTPAAKLAKKTTAKKKAAPAKKATKAAVTVKAPAKKPVKAAPIEKAAARKSSKVKTGPAPSAEA